MNKHFLLFLIFLTFSLSACKNEQKVVNETNSISTGSEVVIEDDRLVIYMENGETAVIPLFGGDIDTSDWDRLEDLEDFDIAASKMQESLEARNNNTVNEEK